MTKNLIPNTETVHELNTEFPSFEEFQKNYQEDKDVIRSYEDELRMWAEMNGYGPGFGEWIAKVAITTVAGSVLGPAAVPVGAVVWGASRAIEENCDDEDVKKVFGFIGDCGGGTFTGGCLGVAAQGAGAVAGFNKIASLGKNCGNCIASAKHGIKVAGTIEFWTSKGFEGKDALIHVLHKADGVEYKVGCAVCEG